MTTIQIESIIPRVCHTDGGIMAVVAKQSKAGTKKAIKQAAAPKAARVISEVDLLIARLISEVDLLIARLKRFRKGQRAGFDLRQAIEDGSD